MAACGGGSTTTNDVEADGGAETGGSSTGGSDTGGSSTGGSSTGGGGTGSSTGGVSSDAVCDDYCANAVAAGCDTPATEAECLSACAIMTGLEVCPGEIEAALACDATAETSCDDAGEVAFAGCELEELAVAACIEDAEPPEALVAPCNAYCAAVAAVDCPAEDPATCVDDCGMVGVLAPSCTADWVTYLSCAAEDTLTCADDGTVESAGCTTESLTAFGCLLTSMAGG